MAQLLVLWMAAFPLMGSPGPATMSLAAMGAAYGVRRALWYLLGIIAGTFGVLMMIATGVTGLILAQPALVSAISVVAAVYIVYLAYRIAMAPVIGRELETAHAPSFGGGFVLAIANPKAFAAIGAVYASVELVPGPVWLDAALKIAALSVVIVAVNSAWLSFGSVFSRLLTEPKTARVANIIFAVLLIASIVLALTLG